MGAVTAEPAVYRTASREYIADSCEPLREAADSGQIQLVAASRGSYPGRRLPSRRLPELRSVGVWDAAEPQSWGLDWHRNEGLEIAFLAAGRLAFELSAGRYSLRPGDLTITHPWQRHRLGDPHVTPSRLSWLILDLGVRRPNQPWSWPDWLILDRPSIDRLTQLLRQTDRPVWRADAATELAFERLPRSLGGPEINVPLLALAVNEVLVALLEMLDRQQPTLDRKLTSSEHAVEVFLDTLADHVAEPWTLGSMAEECGVARTRFAHHCKAITNATPMEYLRRVRIAHAAALLTTRPDLSITEVCFASGFSSSQYFATVFRREQAISPSAYRARIASR
jgi:AraC-like DNA-binding protein